MGEMKILVVHRTMMFADALAERLAAVEGVELAEAVYDVQQCVAALKKNDYDVLVMTRHSLERCSTARRSLSVTRVPFKKIVVGSVISPTLRAEARANGMDAVLDINQPPIQLVRQIREVVEGRRGLEDTPSAGRDDSDVVPGSFATRNVNYHDDVDRQIVRLLATGLYDKEIAAQVHLSSQTVRNRVSRMLKDSDLENRTQLAAMYLRHELGHLLAEHRQSIL